MSDFSGKPDHVDMSIQELYRLKDDVNSLEGRIVNLEELEGFDAQDVRYTRLLREKEMLLTNLCAMRLKLVDIPPKYYSLDKNIQSKSFLPVSNNVTPPLLESKQSVFSSEVEEAQSRSDQPAPVGQTINTDENSTYSATELPQPQLEEYLEKKKEVAAIMRDFTEKKICFFAHDGSAVLPQHYQQITTRVKEGEDIAKFLRGTTLQFVTGIDKKRNSVTEVKIFVPVNEAIRSQATSNSNNKCNGFSSFQNRSYTSPSYSQGNAQHSSSTDLNHNNKRPFASNDTNLNTANSLPRDAASAPDQAQFGRAWEGFTYK